MRQSARFIGKTLLILFLFSCFFLGGLIVGPVSVRMYCSVILLGFLVISGFRFPIYKEIFFYLLFVIVHFSALLFNGDISQIDAFKYFFGRYFVCFIAFYGVYSLIENFEDLRTVSIWIFVMGILNLLVSTLQFSGNMVALQIPLLLNVGELEQEKILGYTEKFGVGVGVIGLFGTIVKNGYFSSIFAVFSLGFYHHARASVIRRVLFILTLGFLANLFFIQQRMVFMLVVLFYSLYIYKNPKLFRYAVGLFIVVLVFVFFYGLGFDPDSLGRISNVQDTNRVIIFTTALDFIANNLFFGGQVKFANILSGKGMDVTTSHNLFLNAFIYSGLVGFFLISIITWKMFMKCWYGMKTKLSAYDFDEFGFFISGSLMIYILNSFVHNSSLVTGDEVIWILFALLVRHKSIEKSSIQ